VLFALTSADRRSKDVRILPIIVSELEPDTPATGKVSVPSLSVKTLVNDSETAVTIRSRRVSAAAIAKFRKNCG
jgi:hypothetical protein